MKLKLLLYFKTLLLTTIKMNSVKSGGSRGSKKSKRSNASKSSKGSKKMFNEL